MQEKTTRASIFPEKIIHAISTPFVTVLSFALLTALAAKITIPLSPVPFTLQTMAVLLSGAFLGAKRGFYAQLLYLSMGAVGVPVFASVADGTFGVLSLVGPTGGYLLAFPAAAFIVGKMLESRRGFGYTAMAFISGEILIIAAGTLFLDAFYIHDIARSVVLGAGVFSVWTAAKLTVVSGIYYGYHRIKK